MKKHYLILIAVILLAIGHITGIYFPKIKAPFIDDCLITQAEYNNMILKIVSSVLTFLAIITALLKDDIRNLWHVVKFNFSLNSIPILESTEKIKSSSSSTSDMLAANQYSCPLKITNNGNKASLQTQVYLEKLTFINNSNENTEEIQVKGGANDWEYENEQETIIPPLGKKTTNIFTLLPPPKESPPDGRGRSESKATFTIGQTEIPEEFHNGKIIAIFSIYSTSCSTKTVKAKISWNGKWHSRLSELSKDLKIELS